MKYTGSLKVDERRKLIDARLDIHVTSEEVIEDIDFFLPSKTLVKNLNARGLVEFQTKKNPEWCPFVSGDMQLTVLFDKDLGLNEVSIEIEYESVIDNLPLGGMNLFEESYVEIGVYSPWFPLDPNFPESHFDVTISNDSIFFIGGDVTRTDQGWRIKTRQETAGHPVIGSPEFAEKNKQIPLSDSLIRVFYTEAVDSVLCEEVIGNIESIITLFNDMYGYTEVGNLDILLSPRKNTDIGGGYCRPGLIVLPCGDNESSSDKYDVVEDIYMFKYLAHELAHLWWNKANVLDSNNWLNESFAEYSCLVAVRELVGFNTYNDLVNDYKSRSIDLGPVAGCTINDKDHFDRWYTKGTFILTEFEIYIGKKQFREFLREINLKKLNTTAAVLAMLPQKDSELLSELIHS